MVRLDHQLIREARRLITAGNVHRVKQMIFAYEQAVDLHNRQWCSHAQYHDEYERALRAFVIAACRRRSSFRASA